MAAVIAVAGTPLKCSHGQTLEQQLAMLRDLHAREANANAAFFEANPELLKAKEKRKKGEAAKVEAQQKAAGSAPEAAAPVAAAVVKPQISLLERLKQVNLQPEHDVAAAQNLEARRPDGHSTHNLLVKCKKTKKVLMISHRQHAKADLKSIAKAHNLKELRMASGPDVQAALGEAAGGCISVLSLWYNKDSSVQVILDEEIANGDDNKTLCICVGKTAGCNNPVDHSQHMVVNIPIGDLKAIMSECGNEVSSFPFHKDE